MSSFQTNTFKSPSTGKSWNYLTAGPASGPLMFFLHGWPGIAATWRPQLATFASLGFHVLAPDMPGYGKTWTSTDPSEFALERIVPQLLELLEHVGRKEAIWIGHDWGCGPLWAIAAHHPEVCTGLVGISVPYRTLELGLDFLISLVDRTLYPEHEFPYGQFDYQVLYERAPETADARFEEDIPACVKLLFSRGSEAAGRAVARTAATTKTNGWFGGQGAPFMQIPLEATVLDATLFNELTESLTRNRFHGATAWYRNHAANVEYAKSVVDGGRLTVPVLFIHTLHDAVCQSVYNPKFMREMRDKCENLSEFVIKAGHWGNLECPEETSAGIAEWILKELRPYWAGPKFADKNKL